MLDIVIRPVGRMTNQMMQVLVAERYAQKFAGTTISGAALAEWRYPEAPVSRGHHSFPKIDIQRFDVAYLDDLIATGQLKQLKIRTPCCNISAFPALKHAQSLFKAPKQSFYKTGAKDLVIHVRLGDILVPGRHRDYPPLPIAYYQKILEENDLRPVFVGELGEDVYSKALRKAFPKAKMIDNGSVLHDFQTLRQAQNIAIGVSTYSWMAAWLGNAKRIFYPLRGLFNPLQVSSVDMVPLKDPRYTFYQFPIRQWNADDADFEALLHGPSEAEVISQQKVAELVRQSADLAAAHIEAWKTQIEARL
ncbi:hypothetical protein [Cypionkella sp.]|jgi:hypothetical protein|uniref:hypothetical protein n=2 Tax=Cypionkella sp. TaxID=2811411 RepID=UPI002FDC98CE